MVEVEGWKNIVKTGNLIFYMLWLTYFVLSGAKLVLKYKKKSDFLFYFICKLLFMGNILIHLFITLKANRDFIASMMFSWFTTISLLSVSTVLCLLRTAEIEDKKDRQKLYFLFISDIAYVFFVFVQVLGVLLLCTDVESTSALDDLVKDPEQMNGLMSYLNKKMDYAPPDNRNKYIQTNRFDGEGIHYAGKMFNIQ